MCGIVGYIGTRQAQPILLDGLRRLEYRGYDSAGIAVLNGGRITVRKCAGRIAQLEELTGKEPLTGSVGIGHTRWATHGEPSNLNAHPHTDVKGSIALVHNGIIENHMALRRHLEGKGCQFISQTDTEVVAHLIHTLYQGDMMDALRSAMKELEGSYALAVINEEEPDAVYCVRLGSPLVVGLGEGEMFLASDIPAILPYTREVVILEDKEIAVLRREDGKTGKLGIFSLRGRPGETAVDLPDGTYSELLRGGEAEVRGGRVRCDGEPMWLRVPAGRE